jgi:hypothetical protein
MVPGMYFSRRMQVCESTSKQMNPWCAKKQPAVQDLPVRLSSFLKDLGLAYRRKLEKGGDPNGLGMDRTDRAHFRSHRPGSRLYLQEKRR